VDAVPSRAEGWDWPHDAESAARLRAALEEAGVEFLGNGTGEGVRLRVCNGATVEFNTS
jgi:hypothetical protein